ncbi:hypothetical protein FQZ97_663450 [compost metagenome]
MIEETHTPDGQMVSSWRSQHRFLIMIGGAVIISLFLVGVGLALYSSSGAAQLDLSRPGYATVRSEATKSADKYEGFSATGPIDQAALEQFRKLFEEQSSSATNFDAFANDVLTDSALKINNPSTDNNQ